MNRQVASRNNGARRRPFTYRQGMSRNDIPTGDVISRVLVEDGVTFIEPCAFHNGKDGPGRNDPDVGKYESLEQVDMAATVKKIGNTAFAILPNLNKLVIPNESRLAEIEQHGFYECSLPEIFLPASLRTLGKHVFMYCRALKGIDLSRCLFLVDLPEGCFHGCVSLEAVILPPNLETIAVDTFRECKKIKELRFPATVEIIGDGNEEKPGRSCRDCEALSLIEFKSARTIEAAMLSQNFHGCAGLHTIELTGHAKVPLKLLPRAMVRLFGDAGLLRQEGDEDRIKRINRFRGLPVNRISCLFSFMCAQQERLDELLEYARRNHRRSLPHDELPKSKRAKTDTEKSLSSRLDRVEELLESMARQQKSMARQQTSRLDCIEELLEQLLSKQRS